MSQLGSEVQSTLCFQAPIETMKMDAHRLVTNINSEIVIRK